MRGAQSFLSFLIRLLGSPAAPGLPGVISDPSQSAARIAQPLGFVIVGTQLDS